MNNNLWQTIKSDCAKFGVLSVVDFWLMIFLVYNDMYDGLIPYMVVFMCMLPVMVIIDVISHYAFKWWRA